MISAAKDAPIDIFYGIPSSVPSTSEKLETTGGVIDFEAMKHLLGEKDVVCVGEIMNYREIIRENHLEISKFLDYLRQEHPGYVIEGHCPSRWIWILQNSCILALMEIIQNIPWKR